MCASQSKNRVVIASAGSGKTTRLVEEALAQGGRPTLIVTYTNENLRNIRSRLIERAGCVPPKVTVSTWFSFLLLDGARPYQRAVLPGRRVESILFDDLPPGMRWTRKSNKVAYYLTRRGSVYRDRVSELVCDANELSSDRVVDRLGRRYHQVLIDEVQDLAGFDLEVLDLIFRSGARVLCVGDPRQAVLRTNRGKEEQGIPRAGNCRLVSGEGARGTGSSRGARGVFPLQPGDLRLCRRAFSGAPARSVDERGANRPRRRVHGAARRGRELYEQVQSGGPPQHQGGEYHGARGHQFWTCQGQII